MTREKLLKRKQSLEAQLEKAKARSIQTWQGLGWGAGMRRIKLVSYSKEFELQDKINEVDELLKTV